MLVVNLRITKRDKIKPCPFCGSSKLRLINTWTPCYWIECECGASLDAAYIVPKSEGRADELKAHHEAKKIVIQKWNRRIK